uniref:TOR n=1 Tax=Arundo donax TaxID=35708 RepID=A0A0A9GDL5_ARUDO
MGFVQHRSHVTLYNARPTGYCRKICRCSSNGIFLLNCLCIYYQRG